MQYPASDIRLLFDLAAAKVGIQVKGSEDLSNAAYEAWANAINSQIEDRWNDALIKTQYLKNLKKDLEKASRDGGKIGRKEPYLNTIAQFLGFKNFEELRQVTRRVQSLLRESKIDNETSLTLLVAEEDREQVQEKLKPIWQGRNKEVRLQVIDFSSTSDVSAFFQKADLVLVAIGDSLDKMLLNQLAKLPVQTDQQFILPLYISNQETDVNDLPHLLEGLPLDGAVLLEMVLHPLLNKGTGIKIGPVPPDPPPEGPKWLPNKWVFIISLSLFVLALILSIILKCPTQSQYAIIKLMSATGLAGFSSLLPDLFWVETKTKGTQFLKAGGALIIFVIVYNFNPASVIARDNCFNRLSFHGQVLMANQPLENASITIPVLDKTELTNGNGEFDLSIAESEMDRDATVHITYRQLDTILDLQQLQEGQIILVNFRDTVSELTQEVINKVIYQYHTRQQKTYWSAINRELAAYRGRKITTQQLRDSYAMFDRIEAGIRRPVEYHNGFFELNTQRDIQKIGLPGKQLAPYDLYGMTRPEVYQLHFSNDEEEERSTYKMQFALLDTLPPTFKVINTERLSRTSYRVQTKHEHPLDYVHVSLDFSPRHNWLKVQKTIFNGVHPQTIYLIEFKRRAWKVTDIINPFNSIQ